MNKTESKIQQDCIRWFKNNYCLKFHSPRCCVFSVPNESKSKVETMNKMAIGMLPGASDFIVIIPGSVLFFETKTDIGRQSDKQKDFEEVVTDLGFSYFLIRSFDEFKNIIDEHKTQRNAH